MMDELVIFRKQLDLKELENELLKLDQVEIPTEHQFMGGIYLRSISVPAGTLIIGKRHRNETCNILLSGIMSIYIGEDQPTKRLTGPCIFRSDPGSKKMGYAHTDCVFMNLHPTNETDLDKIEAEFIIPEEEFLLHGAKSPEEVELCLG
jgi:hypothetical protein